MKSGLGVDKRLMKILEISAPLSPHLDLPFPVKLSIRCY